MVFAYASAIPTQDKGFIEKLAAAARAYAADVVKPVQEKLTATQNRAGQYAAEIDQLRRELDEAKETLENARQEITYLHGKLNAHPPTANDDEAAKVHVAQKPLGYSASAFLAGLKHRDAQLPALIEAAKREERSKTLYEILRDVTGPRLHKPPSEIHAMIKNLIASAKKEQATTQ